MTIVNSNPYFCKSLAQPLLEYFLRPPLRELNGKCYFINLKYRVKKKTTYLSVFPRLLVLTILMTACEDKKPENEQQVTPLEQPSPNKESEVEKKEPRLLISYHLDSIQSAAEVDSFQTKFSPEEQKFIFAINRVDPRRLNAGDQLVIPDTLTRNFMDYAPFPKELDLLDSIRKTVLISRRIQAFAIYEHGKLKRWGPVSSGKESTQTPAGLNYGNYKSKNKVSTVNEDWLLPYYFNFMNFEGVGTHEYSMPGYPASHACVRLRKEDAAYIYNWAEQWTLDDTGQKVLKNGTPFMVFGDYDFDGPVPWLDLAEDPKSNLLNTEEIKVLRGYVAEYERDERNFQSQVIPEEELPLTTREGLEIVR